MSGFSFSVWLGKLLRQFSPLMGPIISKPWLMLEDTNLASGLPQDCLLTRETGHVTNQILQDI